MSHNWKKFDQYCTETDTSEDKMRLFIRRNRKKIWLFMLFSAFLFLVALVLLIYFVLSFLRNSPQNISYLSYGISKNSISISGFISWILGMIQKYGFIFNS